MTPLVRPVWNGSMEQADYVVPQAEDLLRLPGGANLVLKQGLLALYLANPFLDEDTASLALRTGVDSAEVATALEVLCRQGLLREAGSRGYALASVGPECLVAGSSVGSDAALDSGEFFQTSAGSSALPQTPSSPRTGPLPDDAVESIRVLEQFLETLDPGAVASARVALEQVKALLGRHPGGETDSAANGSAPPSD